MAIAYFTRMPNVSPDQARQVIAEVMKRLGRRGPEGALYHAEGPTDDGGWWSINVWESDDAARKFANEYLKPVLNSFGMSVPDGERLPIEWETSSMIPRGG